jgi:hypothetical protein
MRNRVIVPYRPVLPRHSLGGLGGNTSTVASGAASGAAAGSVVGPIGTVVGGVVGAIAGLFGGTSNPQIQIDKTNAINLFSQYQGIAGTVSGRSIGYENMDMIFRGACFMGHFPDWNNETELPDSLMSMPGSPYGQNDNCFAVLWAAAAKGVAAPGSSGKYTGNGGVPVTDAKTFVDNYVWPSNSSNVDTDPWATNTDSVGKQILYDAADAYIATQIANSTPYIANPPAKAQTPVTSGSVASCAPAATAVTTAPTTSAYSPAGTWIGVGSTSSIQTQWGAVSIGSSGQFTVNGNPSGAVVPASGQVGTIGLVYGGPGGQLYAYNNDGQDYYWGGGTAWYATTSAPTPPVGLAALLNRYAVSTASGTPAASTTPVAPATPTVLESADGSEVTGPGTALETSAGTIVFFGPQSSGDPSNAAGYPIWELTAGSAPIQNGYAAGMILANGNLYCVTTNASWFQWVNNTWQLLSSAPALSSPAPTTSTTSSPQSGTSCTPGAATSSTTTGAVVATTATGDTVTDDDIQDLISQMQTQGATAQQTYTAVLQALADQGANVSAGVQSQVASQVSSTVPTTPAATTSDTGILIVAGGLGLLGLLWFMNRRRA